MSKEQHEYTPGDAVAVADLEVGDLIYARRNHATQAPTAPVHIQKLQPSVRGTGLVLVVVQGVYTGTPWIVGWLNPARTFPRAEPVEA